MKKLILMASLLAAAGAQAQTATYPYGAYSGYGYYAQGYSSGYVAALAVAPAPPPTPQPYVLPKQKTYHDFGSGRNSHEDYDWSYWTQVHAGDRPGVHADGTVNKQGSMIN